MEGGALAKSPAAVKAKVTGTSLFKITRVINVEAEAELQAALLSLQPPARMTKMQEMMWKSVKKAEAEAEASVFFTCDTPGTRVL